MSGNSEFSLDDLFEITDKTEEIQKASDLIEENRKLPPEQNSPKVCKINLDELDSNVTSQTRDSKPRIEIIDDRTSDYDSQFPLQDSPELPTSFSGGSSSFDDSSLDSEYEHREITIDPNGQPRQAGADSPEGEFIVRFRKRAEESLFVFAKGVLGRFFLTPHFHKDICEFLQLCPPFRKLCLMPREHAKTAIVSGALPQHILIQPAESNIYFPGMEGSECRILLAGETERMAKKNLRVIKSVFDEK